MRTTNISLLCTLWVGRQSTGIIQVQIQIKTYVFRYIDWQFWPTPYALFGQSFASFTLWSWRPSLWWSWGQLIVSSTDIVLHVHDHYWNARIVCWSPLGRSEKQLYNSWLKGTIYHSIFAYLHPEVSVKTTETLLDLHLKYIFIEKALKN